MATTRTPSRLCYKIPTKPSQTLINHCTTVPIPLKNCGRVSQCSTALPSLHQYPQYNDKITT